MSVAGVCLGVLRLATAVQTADRNRLGRNRQEETILRTA